MSERLCGLPTTPVCRLIRIRLIDTSCRYSEASLAAVLVTTTFQLVM